MAIERRTVIDQIELTRSGLIQIRLGLLLVENGNELDCRFHRAVIPFDGDVETQMAAVNEHLDMMGVDRVSEPDIQRIEAIRQLCAAQSAPLEVVHLDE